MDTFGLGQFGKQSTGKVLFPDACGKETVADRTGRLGPSVSSCRPGAWADSGGIVMISEWITRFRFFLRRDLLARRRTSEFDEELQFHVAQAIAAKMAQGMTPGQKCVDRIPIPLKDMKCTDLIPFHRQYALPAMTRMPSVQLEDFYSRTVTGGRGDLLIPRDQRCL
jgi:hypothetical protein